MASQDPAHDSGSTTTNQCSNCSAYISQRFARVFGDNDDTVHACISCSTLYALRDGRGGARERRE